MLEKISIPQQAARLSEPFTMIDLTQIDDLVLSVYLCQGTMPQHRHLDQDELFLVHSGTISLESDWGTTILRPGELAVVPKGVGHRSSSLLRSLVVLLQPRLMVNRRNGDRLLFALKEEGRLEKVGLSAVSQQITIPFVPVTLVHLDMFAVHLVLCTGRGPWWQTDNQASLVLCYEGDLIVETDTRTLPLTSRELVVVPPQIPYRLFSAGRASVLGVQRHRQP